MGIFNQCMCCACLSKEQSAKVCTYIMIGYTALTVIVSVIGGVLGLSDLLDICMIISLIFLLIGFKERKLSYLKQFNTVFAIYVALETIGMVFVVAVAVMGVATSDYIEDNDTLIIDEETKEEGIQLKYLAIIQLVASSIYYILTVYYYFTTRSYVDELINEIRDEDDIRKVENGAK